MNMVSFKIIKTRNKFIVFYNTIDFDYSPEKLCSALK